MGGGFGGTQGVVGTQGQNGGHKGSRDYGPLLQAIPAIGPMGDEAVNDSTFWPTVHREAGARAHLPAGVRGKF